MAHFGFLCLLAVNMCSSCCGGCIFSRYSAWKKARTLNTSLELGMSRNPFCSLTYFVIRYWRQDTLALARPFLPTFAFFLYLSLFIPFFLACQCRLPCLSRVILFEQSRQQLYFFRFAVLLCCLLLWWEARRKKQRNPYSAPKCQINQRQK